LVLGSLQADPGTGSFVAEDAVVVEAVAAGSASGEKADEVVPMTKVESGGQSQVELKSVKDAAEKVEGEKKEGGEAKEAGEAKEGEEKEEVTTSSKIDTRNLWSFMVIIGFLVLMTVLFEVLKESIQESTKGTDDYPFVMTIFSELTVLGFLALMTFIVGKCGLDHLSLIVYGHADVEEDKAKLGEILEQIHMVIFLIMVIFISEAVGMLIFARLEAKQWNHKEGQVVTHEQRVELVRQFRKMRPAGFFEKLFNQPSKPMEGVSEEEYREGFKLEPVQKTMSGYEIEQLVMFLLQRQKFINDGNSDIHHPPDEHTLLQPGFSYGLYLRKMTAERLCEVVELPVEQWILLMVIVAFTLLMMVGLDGSWEFTLWFWMFVGWAQAGFAALFIKYLHGVRHQLSFDIKDSEKCELQDNRNKKRKRQLAMKKAQLEGVDFRESMVEGGETDLGFWISGVPRYYEDYGVQRLYQTEQELKEQNVNPKVQTGCIPGCLKGQQTWNGELKYGKGVSPRNRMMFNMLLFGKNEVHFHLYFLRFLFLGVANYLAVFYIQIGPAYLWVAYDTFSAIAISFFITLPSLIIYFQFFLEAVKNSVMVTATDAFRSTRKVNEVIRHQKEHRAVMMLRLQCAMQPSAHAHAEHGEETKDEVKVPIRTKFTLENAISDEDMRAAIREQWRDASSNTTSSLEIEQMMQIFDIFDQDGSGSLEQGELLNVFESFGMSTGDSDEGNINPLQKEMLHQIADVALEARSKELDLTNTNSVIMRLDFMNWMIVKVAQANDLDAEHIAEEVFENLNAVKDGELSLSIEELEAGLNRCLGAESGLTYTEVSALICELDTNDDGEFNIEEFENWISKHSSAGSSDTHWNPFSRCARCCGC
jgi:Ca2+-binding EF-hand superfamily protein